ncbi:MAG: cytochrome c [Flavobacteriaceae bacterium]|nr:cytochrome c [Flavobacteriaceae bacterium]
MGLLLVSLLLFAACGGKTEEKKDGFNVERQKQESTTSNPEAETDRVKASELVDLKNKGVGGITKVELPTEIDQAMAAEGEAIFKQYCMACHRVGKKFIGPAPNGILKRRSPEWIMNMILHPEQMVKEDPIAKDLLIEFNGSPMANQGLSEEQARAILEYFRTLEE